MAMISRSLILAVFITVATGLSVSAQTNEPEPRAIPAPETYQKKGLSSGVGFHMFINNFGFGLGGQFRKVVGPFSQVTATIDLTGVRDVSEQRFQFFDQQVIPNKYRRVIGAPMLVGFKHRLFPYQIADNFRLYGMVEGGAIMATVIPYFEDFNNNGFRDVQPPHNRLLIEPINDIFEGWKEATIEWGYAGRIKLGVDFGNNFKKLSSVEFGYNFYYFPQGIQMMEPRRPVLNNQGEPVYDEDQVMQTRPFYDSMSFFGTPQISLVFGSFW